MKIPKIAEALPVAMLVLISCDLKSTNVGDSSSIGLTPRITRAASVTDSLWKATAYVHAVVSATDGTRLANDTVAFYKEALPTIKAPADQGVMLSVEGWNTSAAVIWSGSVTLPPSTHDTSFAITVSAVSASSGGPSSSGTVNAPAFDSASVTAWSTDTFDQPVHVFLSTITTGAVLHYTTDGTNPSASSATYGDTGILVDTSCTVEAIATKAGYTASSIVARKIVLQARSATIKSCSVTAWSADTFDQPVYVKLASATSSAEIRYTLDGSTPTRTSSLYADSLLVDSTRALKAVVYHGKDAGSTVLSRTFALQARPAAIKSYSVTAWSADTFDQPVYVKLVSATPSAEIRYTLDGSTPTRTSSPYADSLLVDSTRTLKAIVYRAKDAPSATTLTQPIVLQVQAPALGAGGDGWPPFKIGMSTKTGGVVIHYARNGNIPTADSARYSDSLAFGKFDDSITYTAIAVDTLNPNVSTSKASSGRFGQIAPWNQSITYGTLTDDRDQQVYRTVKIGTYAWMAENLNYKTDSSWCFDNDTSYCRKYGRVYQWSGSMGLAGTYNRMLWSGTSPHQGACPNGWHVPSDAEWSTLVQYVDSATARAKLSSTSGWSINIGTDAYGFRVLPAGYRNDAGASSYVGLFTIFWSSSQFDASDAWGRGFNYSNAFVDRDDYGKLYGFGLRCREN